MSFFRSLGRNRKAVVGLVIVGAFALMALLGPLLVGDPLAYVAPALQPPSADQWLGTTGQGQSVLAQTIAGSQKTLGIAAFAGFGVVAVGALVGGAAGYFGGRVDDVLTLLINVFLVMPGLPLMVVLAAWLPPGPFTMVGVLVATGWAWNARVFRSQALSIRKRDFVAAATVSGEGALRIIVSEILPNMASLLTSSFIGATVYAIGAQVGLEFLGLGDLASVTWGTNLYWSANDSALLTGAWWTFVPTGGCVALVAFGLSLVNFGIDEVTNPRLAAERGVMVPGEAPKSTPVLHRGPA